MKLSDSVSLSGSCEDNVFTAMVNAMTDLGLPPLKRPRKFYSTGDGFHGNFTDSSVGSGTGAGFGSICFGNHLGTGYGYGNPGLGDGNGDGDGFGRSDHFSHFSGVGSGSGQRIVVSNSSSRFPQTLFIREFIRDKDATATACPR